MAQRNEKFMEIHWNLFQANNQCIKQRLAVKK